MPPNSPPPAWGLRWTQGVQNGTNRLLHFESKMDLFNFSHITLTNLDGFWKLFNCSIMCLFPYESRIWFLSHFTCLTYILRVLWNDSRRKQQLFCYRYSERECHIQCDAAYVWNDAIMPLLCSHTDFKSRRSRADSFVNDTLLPTDPHDSTMPVHNSHLSGTLMW